MDTGSTDEGGQGGFEKAPAEPLGLAVTAVGRSANPRPRASVPPEHQKAVELIADAHRQLMEGRHAEARALFGQAAALELQVLKSVATQPEQGLIAELGARAAIQAGRFELARRLVRKGQALHASEPMQWALLLAAVQADLLEFIQEKFEGSWQVPWESTEEDESRFLVVGGNGRRLVFEVDPDVSTVSRVQTRSVEPTFVVPALRLDRDTLRTLEVVMTQWLRPRRRAEPVADRRGVVEHYHLLDLGFV